MRVLNGVPAALLVPFLVWKLRDRPVWGKRGGRAAWGA